MTANSATAPPRWAIYAALSAVLLIPMFQTSSIWQFNGQSVDESEMVLYAVGFFGWDLDPQWYGYGTVGMYLLFAVYLVLGLLGVLFGHIESLEHYVWLAFEGGWFYQVGRYVFTMLLTASIMMYVRMLALAKVPWWACMAFVVYCVFSIDNLFYANYIRTDTVIAFFTALAALAALQSDGKHTRRWMFALSIACAGALAAKINSISLLGVMGVVAAYHWWHKRLTIKEGLMCGVVYLAAAFLFHPYAFVKIPHTILHMINYVNTFEHASRETTHSLAERMDMLSRIFLKYMHPMSLALLLLLPAALWRYFKVTMAVLITQFFFVAPFITAPELRDYWFIPTFNALRLLSFLSLWACAALILEHLPKAKPVLVYSAVGLLFGAFILYPNISIYSQRWSSGQERQQTRIMAKEWLEKEALGKVPVYLDGNYGYLVPKVYHPFDMEEAKQISRVFIFNRQKNPFLQRNFEKWLQTAYAEQVYGSLKTPDYHELNLFRVDVYPEAGDELRVAVDVVDGQGQSQRYTDHLVSTKGGEASVEGDTLVFRADAEAIRLIFQPPSTLVSNGHLRIDLHIQGVANPQGKLYYKFSGKPWGEAFKDHFQLESDVASVRVPSMLVEFERPFVRRLSETNPKDPAVLQALAGCWFVTSPSIYNRYLERHTERLSETRAASVRAIQEHYKFVFANSTLIERFETGVGSPIEIYQFKPTSQE